MKEKQENILSLFREMSTSNSQNAFNSLYSFYFDRLMRFSVFYVCSINEAEEIVSDTFLALWNNRFAISNLTNVDAYVFSIARHKIIDHFRKKRLNFVKIDLVSIDSFFKDERTPEDDLISKEELLKMKRAINTLPPRCKMTFELVRKKQLSYKEVAIILDISVKTVEAHMTLAVKRLREVLSTTGG